MAGRINFFTGAAPLRWFVFLGLLVWAGSVVSLPAHGAENPPPAELPTGDGTVEIPAQEWPYRPGPRTIRIHVRYPGGTRERVTAATGLMLSLHNWGGEGFTGAPDPRQLADRLDVVAIGVDYLQSGRQDSIVGPEPYDFGWLQALDALRALHFVRTRLSALNIPFAAGRTFTTGGSGGGNVSLMANKLAPRTFACVIDLCGMPKLSDDIAFGLPGGSDLNARYQSDPRHTYYLTPDEQAIRFVGHPEHLAVMRSAGNRAKIIVVHGTEDRTCPYSDAQEMVDHLRAAGLDVEPRYISPADLDGRVFTSAGHPLGNRTEIVFRVAERYLKPGQPESRQLTGASDFERADEIRFPTPNGAFVVSYREGPPTGRFETRVPPRYPDRVDLTYFLDDSGQRQPIRGREDWERRRRDVLAGLHQVMGALPPAARRCPLEPQVHERFERDGVEYQRISFASEPGDRVPAWLLVPLTAAIPPSGKRPAVLCLHQTTDAGKDEPVGLNGDPGLRYGVELAHRGYIVLAPDYPSFGKHAWDFEAHPEYASGSMKAIWDNIRAVDYLQSLPQVAPDRLGVIGHSLGGHNAIFTAAVEPRLQVIVSSCGFTRFGKDDLPSWTGLVYMPRIASVYGNDVSRVPFDFPELIGALVPRAFFCCAATRDSDFDVSGVRETLAAATGVYRLWNREEALAADYPEAPHSFPEPSRQAAYRFLDQHLKP